MRTRFEERPYEGAIAKSLEEKGILRPIARVLTSRGVTSAEDLREDWKSLANPEALEGLKEAARLLSDLREKKGLVTVIADYDCDGATACAIAIRGLRAMGIAVNYLVPDRFKYGYGLSPEIVDLAAKREKKPDLLLTVDNGIVSIEGVARAKELGIAVIITDHHLAGDALPAADAIVNPNLATSTFPSKALAGCGVMYYLLLALRCELRRRGVFTPETQPRLDVLSDLVALGTVADVVSLDKNNRILVSQGLSRVKRGLACAGIQALFEVCGKDRAKATAHDFAFSIAPRINAAGRLTEMSIGIDCLLTDDKDEAHCYAEKLDALNNERRELEEAMQTDAVAALEKMDSKHLSSIVLFDERWHQGVVGLVASRIKEKIYRPVIAFAPDEGGLLKGSGRSIESVHLKDALEEVERTSPGLMMRFGGHAMAAGLTIRRESLAEFTKLFEAAVRKYARVEALENTIAVDGPLLASEINFPLIDAISARIWGQGFEAPLFANEFKVVSQKVLKGSHLKLWLELDGTRFDAIFFRHATPLPSYVRLAYKPEINEFMGRRSVQLVIIAAED